MDKHLTDNGRFTFGATSCFRAKKLTSRYSSLISKKVYLCKLNTKLKSNERNGNR